jgi:hypothetical protein
MRNTSSTHERFDTLITICLPPYQPGDETDSEVTGVMTLTRTYDLFGRPSVRQRRRRHRKAPAPRITLVETFISLAGLTTVPGVVHESARVDGIGGRASCGGSGRTQDVPATSQT